MADLCCILWPIKVNENTRYTSPLCLPSLERNHTLYVWSYWLLPCLGTKPDPYQWKGFTIDLMLHLVSSLSTGCRWDAQTEKAQIYFKAGMGHRNSPNTRKESVLLWYSELPQGHCSWIRVVFSVPLWGDADDMHFGLQKKIRGRNVGWGSGVRRRPGRACCTFAVAVTVLFYFNFLKDRDNRQIFTPKSQEKNDKRRSLHFLKEHFLASVCVLSCCGRYSHWVEFGSCLGIEYLLKDNCNTTRCPWQHPSLRDTLESLTSQQACY